MKKLNSIGQIIRGKDSMSNGQKLALQFLKFIKSNRPLRFSSVDKMTSFLPHLSIQENIMFHMQHDLHDFPNLKLVELIERQQDTTLLKLVNLLPSPFSKPYTYRKDVLWYYAFIQAVLKEKDYLFIHNDSDLLVGRKQNLVRKILLAKTKTQALSTIFTQVSSPILSDIISYQIILTPTGVKIEELADKKATGGGEQESLVSLLPKGHLKEVS